MARPWSAADFAAMRRSSFSSSRASPDLVCGRVATSTCAWSISRFSRPPGSWKSDSGVLIAGCSVAASQRKYSSSIPNRNDADLLNGARRLDLSSNSMGLQPPLEHGNLPELRMTFWCESMLRVSEELVDVCRIEQPPVLRPPIVQHLRHKLEELATEKLECGNRKVSFRTIDYLGGYDGARGFLEDVLASSHDLELRRNASRQLHHIVIQ